MTLYTKGLTLHLLSKALEIGCGVTIVEQMKDKMGNSDSKETSPWKTPLEDVSSIIASTARFYLA